MGEIKSTLDLVLEKTRHLTLSAAEKAEMQLKEARQKIPGYVKRLVDQVLTPEGLLAELEALRPELRQPIKQETARQIGRALDLSEGSGPLLAALERLAEPAWLDRLEEVRRCRAAYQQERAAAKRQAERRILADLAARGIRGSAVVARVDNDPDWQAEERRLRQPCERQLAALRQALAGEPGT